MADDVSVRRLSYDSLRRIAEAYLEQHHAVQTLPIPIENLIESEGIDIIPVEDMLASHEVDAFTSRDTRSIYVDKGVLLHPSPNRYRFSLAHELAHLILHRPIFEMADFADIAEWKSFLESIPDDSYRWMEWQAYAWAGLLLVPSPLLKIEYERMSEALETKGVLVHTLGPAGMKSFAKLLGDKFRVSHRVIAKRVIKDDFPGWTEDSIMD